MVRNVRKTDLKVLAEAVMSMMPMEGKFVVEVDKMAKELEAGTDKVFAVCKSRDGGLEVDVKAEHECVRVAGEDDFVVHLDSAAAGG